MSLGHRQPVVTLTNAFKRSGEVIPPSVQLRCYGPVANMIPSSFALRSTQG